MLRIVIGLSISIITTLAVATFVGVVSPLICRGLNIDPAIAAGPFITTPVDITSLIIYFSLAIVLIRYLV